MPIYVVSCPTCGHHDEIYRTFDRYDDLPECCGEPMHRVVCAPMVHGDIEPYVSAIDGRVINSRSAHREHLKAHKCIEVGNETKYLKPKPLTPPPGLKETIVRVANDKLRSK